MLAWCPHDCTEPIPGQVLRVLSTEKKKEGECVASPITPSGLPYLTDGHVTHVTLLRTDSTRPRVSGQKRACSSLGVRPGNVALPVKRSVSAVESRTSRIPNEPLEMMRRFWAGRRHGRSGANPFFTWNTLMCLLPHEQALECPVAKPRRKTEDGSAGDGWSCAPRSLSSESTTAQLTAAAFPQSHLKLSPVQGLVWRPQKAAT